MEKTIPPCPLVVAKEGEEEINLQNLETWHGETLTLHLGFVQDRTF
jgi:hypothetical protein